MLCIPFSREEEQAGMVGEDDGPNLDELARRMEALERENRELRIYTCLACGEIRGEQTFWRPVPRRF